MADYKAYPKAKDTPSRKSRKGLRNSVFQFNKVRARQLRKEKRVNENVA